MSEMSKEVRPKANVRPYPLGIRTLVPGATCACGKTAEERCPDCDEHKHPTDEEGDEQ